MGNTKYARLVMATQLVAAIAGSTISSGGSASAANPSSGRVGAPPDAPAVSWIGEFKDAAVTPRGCDTPGAYCDLFVVDVAVPSSYWDDRSGGLQVEIAWDSPSNVFMAFISDDQGNLVTGGNTDEQLASGNRSRVLFVPRATGVYTVTVIYSEVHFSDYLGIARFVSQENRETRALFDDLSPLDFAPATIVSANFLGTEPMTVVERPVPGSSSEAIDPQRIFVDWPMSGATQIGQVARSTDGGASFRLLFDPVCAPRTRPTCQTGGGGDTDTDVNPIDGTVYFTDLEPAASVAFASSTDHGDSFPRDRQFAISNTGSAVDRQWIAWARPGIANVGNRAIEAFLSYLVPATGLYVQGIDADGLPIPQPAPQITTDTQALFGGTGPLRVDSTGGPGDGWIYHALEDLGPAVATARASDYQDPAAWKVTLVKPNVVDDVVIFPWLALDDEGNAYIVWATPGDLAMQGQEGPWVVRFSGSPIAHPANNPSKGGRPGTFWTNPARVSLPAVGSALFPEVTAIDGGRIAIAYYGTEDFVGGPDDAPPTARWNAYAAIVTDAFGDGGPPIVSTGRVNHRVAHLGPICTQGAIGCEDAGADRSLADMIDIGVDESGRAAVAFTDNNSGFARVSQSFTAPPFPHFAKQSGGPSLLAGELFVDIAAPEGSVADTMGDATWPNRTDAPNLPALDTLGASLAFDGTDLVAQIPLASASPIEMVEDLETYRSSYPLPSDQLNAARLQYVVRLATDTDIFHLSMEIDELGQQRFFGGRLDSNDRLGTAGGTEDVYAAAYKDDGFAVQGTIAGNGLVIWGPASQFGITDGTKVYSVTAFAMAGPSEAEEDSVFNVMRTVDASPPFDATLVAHDPATPSALVLLPDGSVNEPHSSRTLVATVTGASGEPLQGVAIEWRSSGVGEIASHDATTDEHGRATAVVSSSRPGVQTVFATTSTCTPEGDCDDTSVQRWGPGDCTIFGTPDADVLQGTSGDDVICAFGGNDRIVARGGRDVIRSGSGKDVARGGAGSDRVNGGAGDDILLGGRGRDFLTGRKGADDLAGGLGNDLLRAHGANDRLSGGPGRDKLFGGRGKDACRGRADRKRACER